MDGVRKENGRIKSSPESSSIAEKLTVEPLSRGGVPVLKRPHEKPTSFSWEANALAGNSPDRPAPYETEPI